MGEPQSDHRPPPETILFVEDEILVRMDMAEYLRDCGYRVHEASTADEALETLKAKLVVDLVVTDIRMPGRMDGLALARWIFEHRPGVAIVAASAEKSLDAASPPDMGPVLAKPYTGRDLLDRVKLALEKRAVPVQPGAETGGAAA